MALELSCVQNNSIGTTITKRLLFKNIKPMSSLTMVPSNNLCSSVSFCFILFCFLFGSFLVLVLIALFFLVQEHCQKAKVHYTLFVKIAKYNAYVRCTFWQTSCTIILRTNDVKCQVDNENTKRHCFFPSGLEGCNCQLSSLEVTPSYAN